MSASNNTTLSQVVDLHSRFADSLRRKKKWNAMSEDELWEELCLCVLSSNVPYELAKSAFLHLRDTLHLRRRWITQSSDSLEKIAQELSKPIYLPEKKNGDYRKYRFPNIRAQNIVSAAKTIYLKNSGLLKILKNANSEQEARDILAKNVAGIGLKEASHFLRNIGYSKSLAIIDSHVVAFLKEVEALPQVNVKNITPQIYMRLERILQDLCDSLDLNLSTFDMAIWYYMRGK